MTRLGAWLEAGLRLLYPSRCAVCGGNADSLICDDCDSDLPWIEGNICAFCGKPTVRPVDRCRECRGRQLHFDWARSVWLYRGKGRDLIHALKYKNERRLVDLIAAPALRVLPENVLIDKITWVPLHSSRKVERGYNQAEIAARAVAAAAGLPAAGLLKRSRRTEDQNKLEPAARRSNVKGAFAVAVKEIEGLNILLIDDVYTTGATLSECGKSLKKAGAATVGVMTLARTVLER